MVGEGEVDLIKNELCSIEAQADEEAKTRFCYAARWRRIALIFGTLAAVLAATAAGTGFSRLAEGIPAAACALASVVLGAAFASLTPGERAARHHKLACDWFALANDVRLWRTQHLRQEGHQRQDGEKKLRQFLDRRDKVMRAAGRVSLESVSVLGGTYAALRPSTVRCRVRRLVRRLFSTWPFRLLRR